MRPLFSIHAGEYLVGSHLEERFPKIDLWIPATDTGIDLLATNASATRAVSLQVKFSKDFNPNGRKPTLQSKLAAAGWWTHQDAKIENSRADFWVFVVPSFTERRTSFIVIPPQELLRRLRAIHGMSKKRIHSYLWLTNSKRCWEARGLNNEDQDKLANDVYRNPDRDFTQFRNAWSELERRLA